MCEVLLQNFRLLWSVAVGNASSDHFLVANSTHQVELPQFFTSLHIFVELNRFLNSGHQFCGMVQIKIPFNGFGGYKVAVFIVHCSLKERIAGTPWSTVGPKIMSAVIVHSNFVVGLILHKKMSTRHSCEGSLTWTNIASLSVVRSIWCSLNRKKIPNKFSSKSGPVKSVFNNSSLHLATALQTFFSLCGFITGWCGMYHCSSSFVPSSFFSYRLRAQSFSESTFIVSFYQCLTCFLAVLVPLNGIEIAPRSITFGLSYSLQPIATPFRSGHRPIL